MEIALVVVKLDDLLQKGEGKVMKVCLEKCWQTDFECIE